MKLSIIQTDFLLKCLQDFEFLCGLDHVPLAALSKSAVWKVLKTLPDGREQVLRFLDAGGIINEAGVLTKRPNPATAVALEESGL